MKKIYLIITILLFLFVKINASVQDSISTVYVDGHFKTYCHISTSTSDSISNEVINKFVYEMCYDLDGLFKWGLKGMSLANSKDELLKFDFRATKYDKSTRILRGIGDVIVPGVTRFPDLFIDSKLTQLKYSDGKRDTRLNLVSENTFIKSMTGVFSFVPKGKNKYGYYVLESNIKFGWYFNVFLTQSRYKKIMEWRLKQLVRNIKEESERREKMLR